MLLPPSDKMFYFSVCFPTTLSHFICSLKSVCTQTHQWRSSEAGWLSCNRQKQNHPFKPLTPNIAIYPHTGAWIFSVLRFKDAGSSPLLSSESLGEMTLELYCLYTPPFAKGTGEQTGATCPSLNAWHFSKIHYVFWCHSTCTAQPSSLLNSFIKFMFNFTNTIPGIVPSILNPLTYLIFTLSLCPVYGWGNWRHGEVIKLAQGHTVCEFCAGSMVTVLWLGRNFVEMGLSILGTLKCWLCALANSEMKYDPPTTTFHVVVPVLDTC